MNNIEKKNFWLYAIGRFVSLLGSGVQMGAIPLYILDTTGSGALMGTFWMITMLPALIMSPFAGVMGDRLNRKKIMVNMDYARGFVIFLLAFMAYTGHMSIAALFVCQVIVSFMNSIFGSSTGAMLPELVPSDDLTRANSIMGSLNSFSWLTGPVLGAVLYGFGGIKVVFLINAISFVISAISEMFISYNFEPTKDTKLSSKIFFDDFKEGVSFLRINRPLVVLLGFFSAINFLVNPAFQVVIPYITRKVIGFNEIQFGLTETMFIVGMLIGNTLIAVFFAKSKPKRMVKVGILGLTFINLIFAFTVFPQTIKFFGGATWKLFGVMSGVLIVMGLFNPFINTPLQTNLQKMVPNELRSRVFSVIGLVAQAFTPFGALIYGVMLDLIPAYMLFFAVSFIVLIISIGFIIKAPSEVFEPATLNADKGDTI